MSGVKFVTRANSVRKGDDDDERMEIVRASDETEGEETTGKPIARTTVKARFKAGCSRVLGNSGLEWETDATDPRRPVRSSVPGREDERTRCDLVGSADGIGR